MPAYNECQHYKYNDRKRSHCGPSYCKRFKMTRNLYFLIGSFESMSGLVYLIDDCSGFNFYRDLLKFLIFLSNYNVVQSNFVNPVDICNVRTKDMKGWNWLDDKVFWVNLTMFWHKYVWKLFGLKDLDSSTNFVIAQTLDCEITPGNQEVCLIYHKTLEVFLLMSSFNQTWPIKANCLCSLGISKTILILCKCHVN